MTLISKNIDFHLIKFPIIFPIIYGLVLYFFPSYENLLIYFTIFLLAESHFGATWPFLFGKNSKEFLNSKKMELVFIPLFIILFSFLGFFLFKPFFLLIFYAANIYHVTRQSFGICKLYVKNEDEIILYEVFIYFFNFIFFVIGFLKFYIGFLNQDTAIILTTIMVSLIVISFLSFFTKFKNIENSLTYLSGCLIFLPVTFVENPVHVIIMGVTMHYSQYLVLTNKITFQRLLENDNFINSKNIIFKNFKFLKTIFFYSLIMTTLTVLNKYNSNLNFLIIIPIIGQFLHFYLDSQLWKFSEKYNRENVLRYLLK